MCLCGCRIGFPYTGLLLDLALCAIYKFYLLIFFLKFTSESGASFCSEKAALTALKASDWNLEGAFEVFFNQPPPRPLTDPRQLEEFYLRYKGTWRNVGDFCDSLCV